MIQHVNIFLIVIYYITSAAVQYPNLHYLFYRQLANHAASACPGLENEEEETVRKDGRPENAKEISDSNREMEEASSDEEKKMLSERRKRVATSARKNSAKKSKKFTASSDEEEQEDLEKDGEEHENRKRR